MNDDEIGDLEYANESLVGPVRIIDDGPPCSCCGYARRLCRCGNIVRVEIPIANPRRYSFVSSGE